MAHRGSQAGHEDAWAHGQYELGYNHGFGGKPAEYADHHYQRGYREGLAAIQGLRIVKRTQWLGNGFGWQTRHTAYLNGEVVGEFCRGSVANWAFEQSGIVCLMYSSWRKALADGH